MCKTNQSHGEFCDLVRLCFLSSMPSFLLCHMSDACIAVVLSPFVLLSIVVVVALPYSSLARTLPQTGVLLWVSSCFFIFCSASCHLLWEITFKKNQRKDIRSNRTIQSRRLSCNSNNNGGAVILKAARAHRKESRSKINVILMLWLLLLLSSLFFSVWCYIRGVSLGQNCAENAHIVAAHWKGGCLLWSHSDYLIACGCSSC